MALDPQQLRPGELLRLLNSTSRWTMGFDHTPRTSHSTLAPPEQQAAVVANRRRTRSKRGRKLQRLRSEQLERRFAHVCETEGARRTWLTGIENVRKRYLISAAAHNLGLLMRSLFKMGTARGPQEFKTDLVGLVSSLFFALPQHACGSFRHPRRSYQAVGVTSASIPPPSESSLRNSAYFNGLLRLFRSRRRDQTSKRRTRR